MVELLLLSPVKHPRHWNPQRQHPSQALKPFSSFLLPSLPACGLGKKGLVESEIYNSMEFGLYSALNLNEISYLDKGRHLTFSAKLLPTGVQASSFAAG